MCMNAEPDLIDFYDVQEGEFDLFQYIAAEQQYEDESPMLGTNSLLLCSFLLSLSLTIM